jgi:hypothetical protein
MDNLTTPLKPPDSLLGLKTPDVDESESVAMIFSEMKINGSCERSADIMTVEGSPVHKKMNFRPTPNIKAATPVEPLRRDAESETIKILPRKVLVISSGSDEHDTGEHQENALRTALLCGPEGCLRREQLRDFVVWADEQIQEEVKPAPIADLLR